MQKESQNKDNVCLNITMYLSMNKQDFMDSMVKLPKNSRES